MRCSHLVALGCLLVALAAGAAQQPDPAPRYAIVRFVSLQCVKLAPIGLIEHNHPILLLRNLPLGRELQWRGHTRQGQTLALPLAAVIENQATLRLEEFEFLGRNQFIGEFTVQAAATASTRTVDFKELGHYRLTYRVEPSKGKLYAVKTLELSRNPPPPQGHLETVQPLVDGFLWRAWALPRDDSMRAEGETFVLPAVSQVQLNVNLEQEAPRDKFKPTSQRGTPTTLPAQAVRWDQQPAGERTLSFKLGRTTWRLRVDVQPWP